MTPSLENIYSSHTFLSKAIGQKDLLGLKFWNGHSSAYLSFDVSGQNADSQVYKGSLQLSLASGFSSCWCRSSWLRCCLLLKLASKLNQPLNNNKKSGGGDQEGTGMLSLNPAPNWSLALVFSGTLVQELSKKSK